jgi:hypothetical protein
MSLHANLGLRFMLEQIRPALKSGDIVLVFPEYEQFFDDIFNGVPEFFGITGKYCLECMSALSTPTQYFSFASGLLQTTEKDMTDRILGYPPANPVYLRNGFDKHGDFIGHLGKPGKTFLPIGGLEMKNFNQDIIPYLNDLEKDLNSSKVQIYLIYPGITELTYNENKGLLRVLSDKLDNKLSIPILGEPQDSVYPMNFFFDTNYHMTGSGREKHTLDIIDMLKTIGQ